jgi:pimeloyl-ACP methyl ester carboxylesterase
MQADLKSVFDAVVGTTSQWSEEPKMFVYGRSIGSIFALAFAAGFSSAVRGLILESGIAHVSEWVKWYVTLRSDVNAEDLFKSLQIEDHAETFCAMEYLNTRARLQMYTGPLLVLHTAGDTVVVPEHAHAFHRFAEMVPSRTVNKLVIWETGGHNDIHSKNLEKYLQELTDFACAAVQQIPPAGF